MRNTAYLKANSVGDSFWFAKKEEKSLNRRLADKWWRLQWLLLHCFLKSLLLTVCRALVLKAQVLLGAWQTALLVCSLCYINQDINGVLGSSTLPHKWCSKEQKWPEYQEKGMQERRQKASKIFANILCKYCQDLNFVQFLDLVELDFCSKKKDQRKIAKRLTSIFKLNWIFAWKFIWYYLNFFSYFHVMENCKIASKVQKVLKIKSALNFKREAES